MAHGGEYGVGVGLDGAGVKPGGSSSRIGGEDGGIKSATTTSRSVAWPQDYIFIWGIGDAIGV
ncbi:hypothetical protein E2562_024983 [Oryza meyeriana var. granulata]|uniref:Uncharacterized protein n=1 Tax=Oryza meyeriana var. granulata TaxID=110450 RepID=A0A6G1DNA1_9ORYZ|nr:hypothetical protein E2562_024983 [Oryza meyeriana var. granulata]